MCRNYSKEETIQGWKLYEEIRYTKCNDSCKMNKVPWFFPTSDERLMNTLLPKSFCCLEHFTLQHTLITGRLWNWNTLHFGTACFLEHFTSWNNLLLVFQEAKDVEKDIYKLAKCSRKQSVIRSKKGEQCSRKQNVLRSKMCWEQSVPKEHSIQESKVFISLHTVDTMMGRNPNPNHSTKYLLLLLLQLCQNSNVPQYQVHLAFAPPLAQRPTYVHAALQKQDRSFAQLCALRAMSNKRPEINRAEKMGPSKNL